MVVLYYKKLTTTPRVVNMYGFMYRFGRDWICVRKWQKNMFADLVSLFTQEFGDE